MDIVGEPPLFVGKGYGVNFPSISQAHSGDLGDLSWIWKTHKQVNLQQYEDNDTFNKHL